MTDVCQASTHSVMLGAPKTKGYKTPGVTVTQLAARGPVTQATVSASQLSPESAATGVDQVTTIWMGGTLRAVPSVFATDIQPAAAARGTTVSIKSPLTSNKMLMAGRLSKETGLLQSSIGHSAIGMCLAQHGDQTLSIL